VSLTRVGIAGLGLIGASIGLGLRRAGYPVAGCEPDPQARELALRRGAAEAAADDIAALAHGADVIFLAAPPLANLELLGRLAAAAPPAGLVVTDTGSVKRDIAALGRSLWASSGGPVFVPGHPMAGLAGSGPGAARADLFEGAPWYLCPEGEPPATLLPLLAALGARVVRAEAAAHDRAAARLSHVPQLLAWVQARRWAEAGLSGTDGGPVARELARLAASPRALWADILMSNRDAVADALGGLGQDAERLAEALGDADPGRARAALEALFP